MKKRNQRKIGDNGSVIYEVPVKQGFYAGHTIIFTQHSPDRYTVRGLEESPHFALSIERRRGEVTVLRSADSAVLTLRDEDQWIAYETRGGSYYGARGVGSTARDAWHNSFDRFNHKYAGSRRGAKYAR
jgi:hypothetical protein